MSPSRKKPTPSGGVFDPQGLKKEIDELEAKTLQPGFWDDRKGAEQLFTQLNGLKDTYQPWKELITAIDEMEDLIELYSGEPDNEDE